MLLHINKKRLYYFNLLTMGYFTTFIIKNNFSKTSMIGPVLGKFSPGKFPPGKSPPRKFPPGIFPPISWHSLKSGPDTRDLEP